MSARARIQAAPGLRVLDPATGRPLGAEPVEVDLSTYWRRRLADGSVTRAALEDPPKPDPQPGPAPRPKRRGK